jgi:hypothetical protein
VKLDKTVTIKYAKGSRAELTSANQEIERLHAELWAAELTTERESSAAQQLHRQLQKAEDTQKGEPPSSLPFTLRLLMTLINFGPSSHAALESDLATKGEETIVLKTQLELLSAAAQVAVDFLPSSSSATEQSLPSQLEQLPCRIRGFVADKMRSAAAMALAQAKSVFKKMDLKSVSLGFAKDCSDDLVIDLFAEAMAHAPNIVQGMNLDPEKENKE